MRKLILVSIVSDFRWKIDAQIATLWIMSSAQNYLTLPMKRTSPKQGRGKFSFSWDGKILAKYGGSIMHGVVPIPTKRQIAPASHSILIAPHEKLPKSLFQQQAEARLGLKLGDIIKARIQDEIYSPEFWLGAGCSILTRIAFRYALGVLAPAHGLWAILLLTTLFAYIGAGITAGIVVHFLITFYRNFQITAGAPKLCYGGIGLLESAQRGLLGGIVGGFIMALAALILRMAGIIVGMCVGACLGGIWTVFIQGKATRSRWRAKEWALQIMPGAIFGAIGGFLGVAIADVFAVHNPVVASPLPLLHEANVSAIEAPIVNTQPQIIEPQAAVPAAALSSQDAIVQMKALEVANNALPHAPRHMHIRH